LDNLVDICVKYNLRNDTHYDEGGTDKEFNHRYCQYFYDKEFAKYRNLIDLRICEVGIHRGGSLLLWHHYFTYAVIYGIDPYDFGAKNRMAQLGIEDRVKVVIQDGYDFYSAMNLPTFDIIIDDGPHTKESHLAFLSLYIPKLRVGGVLVIEDIADIEWIEDYKKLVPEGNKYTYEVVDISGKMIINSKTKIDFENYISNLNNGLYFLQLNYDDNTNSSHKIIKN
jgi:hypothetical protein